MVACLVTFTRCGVISQATEEKFKHELGFRRSGYRSPVKYDCTDLGTWEMDLGRARFEKCLLDLRQNLNRRARMQDLTSHWSLTLKYSTPYRAKVSINITSQLAGLLSCSRPSSCPKIILKQLYGQTVFGICPRLIQSWTHQSGSLRC